MVGFMIRRISDGLFSSGGYSPRFNTTGKVWRNANTFHNHLAMFRETSTSQWDGRQYTPRRHNPNGIWLLPKMYRDCEVVMVEFKILKATHLVEYCRNLKPGSENL